jgi:hypothetical protein
LSSERLAAADPGANVLSWSRQRGSVAENLISHKTNRTTTNWSPKLVLNPCYTFFRSKRQEQERERHGEKHRQRESEIWTSYGMQQTEGDRKAKLMNRVVVHSCFLSFVYTATSATLQFLQQSFQFVFQNNKKSSKKVPWRREKKTLWMIARAAQNSLDSNLLASFFRHRAICRYYNISPRQSTKTSHQLLKSLVLKAPSSCTSTWNRKSSYENNSDNNNHKTTQQDHDLLTHLFHSKNNNDRFQRLSLSLSLSLSSGSKASSQSNTQEEQKIIITIIKAGFKLDLFPAKNSLNFANFLSN